jgi:beta-galactosidase
MQLLTMLAAVPALAWAAPRSTILLSGPGWTCDGEAVSVPHTWNAIDGADGVGMENEDSASAASYLRKLARYRRSLPDPTPGRRQFIRCEAVCDKAVVYVNGKEAGRHTGAFTAFCFDVTGLMRPSGNVLEITADNRYDIEVPPIQADFTMHGGIYRDVWMYETDQVHIDPTVDGASGVEIDSDSDTGEINVRVRVKGAESAKAVYYVEGPGLEKPVASATPRFKLPGFRLWSPETPNVYTLTVRLGEKGDGDMVTLPFGFRKIEFRKDGFYLNGVRRQMHGVNYHQDREGKGWAISRDDIAEDIGIIRELGADAIRTAHYPHSDWCYERCDREGLLAWVEAPNVNRIRFTEEYARNSTTLVREMVAQLKHHPSIFTWSTWNEINFKGQKSEDTVPFLKKLDAEARAQDSTRPVSLATFRDFQVAENATAEIIGFNYYPGWYRSTPDGMHETVSKTLSMNPKFSNLCVSEYGAGASVHQHAELLSRGGSSGGKLGCAAWHPEEYQAWVHYRNYRQIVKDERVWGSFVWLMFDFAADVVNEGYPFGLNDKGLMTFDHKTKKDAYWFYRANWRSEEPMLHLVGKRLTSLTNATAGVLAFSTVGEVTFKLNGKVYGTAKPDETKSVYWLDVPLQMGTNTIELAAGGRVERATWVRFEYPEWCRIPGDRPWVSAEEKFNCRGRVAAIDMAKGTPESDATAFWADKEKTQGRFANYDESKAGVLGKDYILESPLEFIDGRKVETAEDWKKRRLEILDLLEREEYGRMPPPPETNLVELVSERMLEDRFILERRYRQYFRADKTGPVIDWLAFVPRYAKGKIGVMLHLNYRGNDHISEKWRTNHYKIPIDMILARGYVFMTAHYQQITCDPKTPEDWRTRLRNGVHELWGWRDPKATDNTGALMAWAWGLCRGLDLAAQIPEVDESLNIVIGSSRLGKAALLAGAYDERVAVTVPNQTGGGGVDLMKRNYGETSAMMHWSLPHWFCEKFWQYEHDQTKQPFDQHLLLAAVAPRALLLECYHKKWFDPKGEFMAAQAASCVWEKLTGKGLGLSEMPPEYSDVAAKPPFGFVRRTECHGLASYDWMWALDFAEKVFEGRK